MNDHPPFFPEDEGPQDQPPLAGLAGIPSFPRALCAGDVSARRAYRWLRRQPHTTGGDVYLEVRWDFQLGWDSSYSASLLGLRDDTAEALHALDLSCKTLDDGPGFWRLRTRSWRGRDSQSWTRGDRALGRGYASLLAALCRAASRDGHALTVRCF